MSTIAERIDRLLATEPNPSLDYYAITLASSEEERFQYSCFSGWVGYTDDTPKREIRKASIVHADRCVRLWREIGESAAVVDTPDDMGLFFLVGGHGVVEVNVAHSVISEWLKPTPVARVGEYGYVDITSLPSGSLSRAPTPKHRMKILKRDKYRCRVCGRSAADYVDVELHVHHVRPWQAGGVTEDSNLITLCHTCHKGLAPHFDPDLFSLMSDPTKSENEKKERRKYWESVIRYRKRALSLWDEDSL
ncbi:HNH endonuclease [Azonexus sp. IMCC34842]|uniref:HNH endonuclease n=1 Tax=Azonexus sp. IMCC34842 TaxID=3420950 RepID=UPI003D0D3942